MKNQVEECGKLYNALVFQQEIVKYMTKYPQSQ